MSEPPADNPWPTTVDWCDITLPTPAENLAFDEVLLQQVDAYPQRAFVRTWESPTEFVVVGRSNLVETEVDQPQCYAEGVPIFRRSSGGGTVVVGPGCLSFALALPITEELRAAGVSSTAKLIMHKTAAALDGIVPGITVCGVSDLVVNDRKFSGNSQRWLKHALLHHGTILYEFNIDRVQRLLKPPSRQPDYRSQRSHTDFVTNLAAPREQIINSIVAAWNGQPVDCPTSFIEQAGDLARSRYERDDWNLER